MTIESKAKGEVALSGMAGSYYSDERTTTFGELKEFVTQAEVAGTTDSDLVHIKAKSDGLWVEPEAELIYMPSRQGQAIATATDAFAVLWKEFKPMGLPVIYFILIGITFLLGAIIF